MVDKELLDILVCPKCRGNIKIHNNEKYIICENCNLAYYIDENMPVMLIDKAVSIESIEEADKGK